MSGVLAVSGVVLAVVAVVGVVVCVPLGRAGTGSGASMTSKIRSAAPATCALASAAAGIPDRTSAIARGIRTRVASHTPSTCPSPTAVTPRAMQATTVRPVARALRAPPSPEAVAERRSRAVSSASARPMPATAASTAPYASSSGAADRLVTTWADSRPSAPARERCAWAPIRPVNQGDRTPTTTTMASRARPAAGRIAAPIATAIPPARSPEITGSTTRTIRSTEESTSPTRRAMRSPCR